MTIMREIDFCFPRTKENHFRVQTGMVLREERQGSVVCIDEFMASTTSMRTGSTSVYDMAESVSRTDASLSVGSKIRGKLPIRRCLVLSLNPEQKVPLGPKRQVVKSQFAKLNHKVKIIGSREKENSYILVFDNEEKPLKANAQFYNLGYQLQKYRPRRASPGNRVLFKVFSPVTGRVGKSFKSKKVEMLEKNDIILMNQVKGRRARVISFQNGGPVGWVSSYGDQGEPLLEGCEHTHIR